MRQLLMVGALVASLCAGAQASAAEAALKVDTRALPLVRIYLPAPDGAAWTGGTAELTLGEAPAAETLEALDWAAGQPELAPLPTRPTALVGDLQVQQIEEQQDPTEGRLVVFLVDASRSMQGRGIHEAKTLLATVVNSLRPIDKVAITRFGEASEDLLPPTPVSDTAAIRAAAEQIEVMRTASGTRLYDALATAVESHVRQLPEPTLPGRRFFMVFSDGMDGGSAIKVEDFDAAFQRLEHPPAVFTVGVGSGASSRLQDLERIAFKAGSRDRFLKNPDPQVLVEAFEDANEALQSQLLVEAELPVWYQREGSHAATVRLAPTQGAAHTFPVDLAIQKLPEAARTSHEDYSASLQRLVDAHAAYQEHRLWLLGGGGGLLLLAIGGGIGASARKRKREAAFAAEIAEEARRDEEAAREARIQSQLDAQAQEAKAREARMVAHQELSARRAALANRVPLVELLCTDGPLKGERFGIFKPRTRVGREAERCELVLTAGEKADLSISRLHAEFALEEGGWSLLSLSAGVVHVAGKPLQEGERYPVRLGDTVGIGQCAFLLRGPA